MAAEEATVKVFGAGNPLLDISCNVTQAFYDKYKLKPSNAILAEQEHMPIYEELSNMPGVQYIAGGSTLNSIRVCQWVMQEKGATGFVGCIGEDKNGETMSAKVAADGVTANFQKVQDPTGTCAVAIIDSERSMVANLSAANKIQSSYLNECKNLWSKAKVCYSAGFWLTVDEAFESLKIISAHCVKEGQTFAMNLSAPFIVQFFTERFKEILQNCRLLFGNEDEAQALAQKLEFKAKDTKGIALELAATNKETTIVFTQGAGAVIVVENGKLTEYETPKVPKEEIVDVNGAGDGFVGGFLSQFVNGEDTKTCVAYGNYAAQYIIRRSGTTLEGKPNFQ